jgi:S1-C subfamily serine protease
MSNDASTWYVIVGVVDKSFDQNQAKELFDSGKIKIRGPYTEDEIKKYYDTGMLKTNNMILKKGENTWKPVHSYDDNFIKSLVHNEVFSNKFSSNNETANPPDPLGEIAPPSKTNISKISQTPKHDENALYHRPLLYFIIVLLVAIAGIYLYYDMYYCSPREFFKRNKKNIVVIYTEVNGKERGLGSGFFIHKPGFIVTNLHVIAGATSVKVKGGKNNLFNVERVVYVDPQNDLALIKVAESGVPPGLDLGTADDLQVGDNIFAIGNPAGLEFSLSEGIVSGIRNEDPNTKQRRDIIQITASISPGNSGGPVINKRGKVVGVATLSSQGAMQNINFAVPITPIMQFKDVSATAYKFVPSEPKWIKILSTTESNLAHNLSTTSFYETNTVADIGNNRKRFWVVTKTSETKFGYSLHEGQVPFPAIDTNEIALVEYDCSTTKYRWNYHYEVVNGYEQLDKANFTENNEWLVDELKDSDANKFISEICSK